MPWTAKDATRHTKKADTPKKKRQWASVANSARERCIEGGGDAETCDARAIKQANAAVAEMEGVDEMTEITGYGEAWNLDIDGAPIPITDLVEAYRAVHEAKVMKTRDGKRYPASDFLVVEDPEKATTWHLPVKKNGTPDHRLMAAARAALTSTGGHRGQQYKGPQKQSATRKLKALYKAEEMEWSEVGDRVPADFAEAVAGSVDDFLASLRDAFRTAFGKRDSDGYLVGPYPRDVFVDDPDLGNVVVCREGHDLYAVGYQITDGGFTFDDRMAWTEVVLTYKPKEAPAADTAEAEPLDLTLLTAVNEMLEDGEVALAESATGRALSLREDVAPAPDSRRAPLKLEVALINAGWGNAKDNNYYPAEILERDGPLFVGAKMYATDHRQDEKSVRTEVATITEVTGLNEEGALVGIAGVHDPGFAEGARNRKDLDTLNSLECSILGKGRTSEGEVDGREGNIVEAITQIASVDWVTRGGAGGRALNIAESEEGSQLEEGAMTGNEEVIVTEGEGQEVDIEESAEVEAEAGTQETVEETETPEPEALTADVVQEILGESTLPGASRSRLAEASYQTREDLDAAIVAEVEYVKTITGSGKPVAQGEGAGRKVETGMSEEDYEARLREIEKSHGLRSAHLREAG
jgi:hypothetical protein